MTFKTEQLELGKKSSYDSIYNPSKLFAIAREPKRVEIGINPSCIPFWGFDSWNHYEVSWLNSKGKPIIAMAEVVYDCHSPFIIESKSLKLYFNSFNNSQFASIAEVEQIIRDDLSKIVQAEVYVAVNQLGSIKPVPIQESFFGESIDNIDVSCSVYTVDSSLLTVEKEYADERLHSDLLKSNCLVTYQPDWGSVLIEYKGSKINRKGLLKYIVSFRNHNEFHEQCIERIFIDILNQCQPQELTVYGRYTRRGGLDINPYRSTQKVELSNKNIRLLRQ